MPKRPGDEVPTLPDDITSLSDRDLMLLMRQHLAWVEYSGYRLARGEIEERELDMQINMRTSFLLVSNWAGGSDERVAIAKAKANDDKEITDLRERHMKAQAYRKIVANLYDSAERRVSLISRELTRRTSMEPAQRRSHRSGGA